MTPEQAKQQAMERAGLADFGPDDFEEGLARLLAAFPRMPIRPATREMLERKTVNDLANRLKMEAWHAAHPEIAGMELGDIVMICGMPRTGTTATGGMLALDTRLRFLRGWEAQSPIPPPIAGEEATDPRRLAAIEAQKSYSNQAQHLSDPDGAEEDISFLTPYTMHQYYGWLPMPADYLQWWVEKDFAPHYAYLERIMKLLHSSRGPRDWQLRSPPHLFKLQAYAARFPQTKFIWTHRDPAKVIPSSASLQYGMQAAQCEPGALDPQAFGRQLLQFWRRGVDLGLAARAAIGEHRFIDVTNTDVVTKPIETFERIYAHIGLPLEAPLRARLEAYNRQNAPGAFGEHKYEPEQYGLTRAGVRATFKAYCERFAV